MDSEKHNALKSLISSLPAYIDGKKLLIEMKQNNLPNWKQKEFISFEIERLCLKYLESFGFEPKKAIYDGIDHGKVKIDTFKDYPIDIKTSFDSKGCILNDKNTMDKIIKQYGCFGIIKIVCKANKDDNYEVTNFQNELKGSIVKNEGRKVKKEAYILKLEYYLLTSKNIEKDCTIFSQGKNSNGNYRREKYMLKNKAKPLFTIIKE